ncbi:double zinc ribbon and ankyrin repeat-containing protein 1 [Amia ocellicauda]|uniref:double zinc ribbon and ankyrin repeat-containing protein 1 n=1 Tax=Amia ocellicauda TaxID=2972642 RepID=UPI003464E419
MTAGSIVAPQIIPIRVPLPGKSKNQIDTSTPVEIKSDTPDVSIYFTLDGSKPEVVKKPGSRENSTLKYRGPITLPEGKVSVKAFAITRDGRESAVVTKFFLVEFVPSSELASGDEDEDNFLEDYKRDMARQESVEGSAPVTSGIRGAQSTWEETTKKYQSMMIQGSSSRKAPKGPRFLSSRLDPLPSGQQPGSAPSFHRAQTDDCVDVPLKSLTSTQLSRIQRETDFLRCPQCLSPRPSDPFARFCLQCGAPVPPVPGHRLPPPEGGQMGLCVHCKTMVPVNTPTCIVCEAPIAPQLQPQASIRLKDKVICRSCGTGNPMHISHCVTCETKLPQSPSAVHSGQSAPPVPSTDGKPLSCSKCGRVNTSDARFCDWCGAKPSPPSSYLTCSQCGASSHPYANFCGSCGVYLEAPPRADSRASMVFPTGGALNLDHMPGTQRDSVTWQPLSLSLPLHQGQRAVLQDQQTQTVGLFYPSGTELHKKELQAAQQLEKQEQMRDRKPLLTAISPGRGYWRKQLDHICAHLRSYTQSNPEFRALIAEPRMGKMISAVVHEDNYEVSLRINFVLAGDKNGPMGKTLRLSENNFLSSVTEGRNDLYSSQTSLVSENSAVSAGVSRKKKKSKKKGKTQEREDRAPQSKDKQLLKELGPDGKGRISVTQQLLDEGADPNSLSSDGRPALTVAVLGKHHEVLPVLVHKGADIDQQSGPVNNTALHEAAALGNQGLLCAETLLGCNASIKKKNDKGLTVYDLAVKSGCDPLISRFAAKMGQGLLDKLSKPRNINLDVF